MTLRDMHMTEIERPVNLHTSSENANPESRSVHLNPTLERKILRTLDNH